MQRCGGCKALIRSAFAGCPVCGWIVKPPDAKNKHVKVCPVCDSTIVRGHPIQVCPVCRFKFKMNVWKSGSPYGRIEARTVA